MVALPCIRLAAVPWMPDFLLAESGVETVGDLAFIVTGNEEADRLGIRGAWLEARSASSLDASARVSTIVHEVREAQKRTPPIIQQIRAKAMPLPSRQKIPKKVAPPAPSGLRSGPDADESRRRDAALQVAKVVDSWGARGGLCKGITAEQRRAVSLQSLVERLTAAQLEAITMRNATRTWLNFVEFCKTNEFDEFQPAEAELLTFCSEAQSATGPLSRWIAL